MLEDQILNDYKQAMKDKNSVKVATLSFLRSELKYSLIEKKVDKLPDADAIAVIKKQVKQREDSIAQFEKGGRADLVAKESEELAILKSYLPQEMAAEELKSIIGTVIQESGAKGMKDMGNVMKTVLAKAAGRADSTQVSQLVKEKLSQL